MVEKRGRKGGRGFEVVPLIPGEDRPGPPDDMSEREAEVWRSVVNAMPSRWFGRETWPLLRGLCLHQVLAERLAEKLRDHKKLDDEHEGWMRAYRLETASIALISQKLRLTPQTRQSARKAESDQRNSPKRRPWEM